MEHGIGYFVADNVEEIKAIEAEAARRGIRQKVLLRLTPGIDPHTYEAISTGKVDSKFGSAIETGQAEEITVYTLGQPHVELVGFHCHVGSQVFAEDVFERAAVIMLEFIADMEKKHGFVTRQLDLGGGYGVRYVESDPYLDVDTKVGQVAAAAKGACERLGIALPEIHMEPGRSIVADAGLTLYTVGTVKQIPGYKNYVSIDGGMPDNPRFALYKADYTCLPAGRMGEPRTFACSVVGRCCESGDIIQEHVSLPESVGRGDILVGAIEGWPGLDELLPVLERQGAERVILAPLLLTAGAHVREDIAGPGPESWKSRLEAAGLTVHPVLEGLGRLPQVQGLYVRRLEQLLEE